MKRWRNSYYVISIQIDHPLIDEVLLSKSAESTVSLLQESNGTPLRILLGIIILGIIGAGLIARWLSRPLSRLSNLVMQTENAVIITNSRGMITWANQSFSKMFNISRDNIIGKRPDEILFIQDNQALTSLSSLYEQDSTFYTEIAIFSNNAAPVWVRITADPITTNDHIHEFCITFDDISEIKIAENKTGELQKFQQLILDIMPAPLCVKNRHLEIVLANTAYYSLYPTTVHQNIIGGKSRDLHNSAESDRIDQQDRDTFREGYIDTEETIHPTNGSQRTLHTRKIRFSNDTGEMFILAVANDITKITEANQSHFAK